MRHAKSDWDADYGRDHERPLNERGVRSARLMGKILTAEQQAPDLVISSTAVRARSTAALAKEAGGWAAEIILDEALYGTGADAAIKIASSAPDVARLMLVGHQPTWSTLVTALSAQRVEMRTATVAVIGFEIDGWPQLPNTTQGMLAAIYHPRDYFGTHFDSD